MSGLSTHELKSVFAITHFGADNIDPAPSIRHRHSNVGAIAGGIVGGIAAAALVGVFICLFNRCRRRRSDRKRLEEKPARPNRPTYTCGPRRAQSVFPQQQQDSPSKEAEATERARNTVEPSPTAMTMANSPELV